MNWKIVDNVGNLAKSLMPTHQQSLKDWVAELNDTMFIQPNDEIAIQAVHEQVDPSLVVKCI
jgi:hypothetical protein